MSFNTSGDLSLCVYLYGKYQAPCRLMVNLFSLCMLSLVASIFYKFLKIHYQILILFLNIIQKGDSLYLNTYKIKPGFYTEFIRLLFLKKNYTLFTLNFLFHINFLTTKV